MNNAKTNLRRFCGKCFNCGKIGHKSCECRSRQTQGKMSYANVLTTITYNTELTAKLNSWCLDSGATKQMCDDTDTKIYTAGKHFIKSIGLGDDIQLNLKSNGYNKTIILENVLYVPELRNNLLSMPAVMQRGYSVTFVRNCAYIKTKEWFNYFDSC